MQKLLEKVEVLLAAYCQGAGCQGRRFRNVAAIDDDGKKLCGDCARHSIVQQGYRYKSVKAAAVETSKPSKKSKVPKPRMQPKKRITVKLSVILKGRILEILEQGGGRTLTREEILPEVSDITKSQQTLNLMLWEMRREGAIAGLRLAQRGRMAYVLPNKRDLVKTRFGLSHEQHIIELLGRGKLWFMAELADEIGRRRTVVNRWVRRMERGGEVATDVISIPGERGTRKICFKKLPMQPSTQILLADLEAKPLDSERYHRVVSLVKSEYYNYLRSPLPDAPQSLIEELLRLGFYDLVEKAKAGAYDAREEEYKGYNARSDD